MAIEIGTDRSTMLYGSKATTVAGAVKQDNGRRLAWTGDAELGWEISVPAAGRYELYLNANVQDGANEQLFTFRTEETVHELRLGPPGGFRRTLLCADIALNEGVQRVELSTEGIAEERTLMQFRCLELLPLAAKEQIAAEEARAVASRASVEWMREAGYGLMFHWTSQSVQRDGSVKPYAQAVAEFDVEQFAQIVEATGAGYVMLTIGHAESYCPAPIKSWEKVHPGHTTERDLIEELADALAARGVRFLCYINGPLCFDLEVKRDDAATDAEKQAFVTNFQAILTEMGHRYGSKVAGYWFDSWYQIFEEFPEVPFEAFQQAARAGYDGRIICLNSWVYPAVSSWQDCWAGEVCSPVELPVDGVMATGPVTNLPYQALLIMEPYWVQKTAEMPTPRLTSAELASYIQNCNRHRGVVTVNLGIYQDGTVGDKALQVMRGVKGMVRGNDE